MEQEKYLSEQEFDPNKHCAICRCNGAVRKHNYYFSQNRKAKVCVHCALKFSFPQDIIAWLETNAIYGPTGKLIDFCQPTKPSSNIPLVCPLGKGDINEKRVRDFSGLPNKQEPVVARVEQIRSNNNKQPMQRNIHNKKGSGSL